MLSKLYVDNFRCLENFEVDLDPTNVLLGRNGTGKTSILNVLRNIQNLVVRGSKVDAVFPARDISLHGQRNEQRFEIETRIEEESYCYSLLVQHDDSRNKMRVWEETLEHDGNPIFEFRNGNAQLYHDDYSKGPEYPFDWSQSGISFLNERTDNKKLTRFKKEIANYTIVSCCPPVMEAETRTEVMAFNDNSQVSDAFGIPDYIIEHLKRMTGKDYELADRKLRLMDPDDGLPF